MIGNVSIGVSIAAAFALGMAPSWLWAAELEDARALWREAGVSDYVYGYRKHCDCYRTDPPETVVTVRDGSIARVHHLYADSSREVPAREGSLDLYWTVEDLFALVESARSGSADALRVEYDTALGHPLRVYVDYDAALVGDELDVRLTRLEPAAP